MNLHGVRRGLASGPANWREKASLCGFGAFAEAVRAFRHERFSGVCARSAPGGHDPLSARRAWRNERGSTPAVAVKIRRRLLVPRSEVCRLPAFAAAPVRGCPAVYDVLPPMADRPPPKAPQVRCAHAPSLDGPRTLQVCASAADMSAERHILSPGDMASTTWLTPCPSIERHYRGSRVKT